MGDGVAKRHRYSSSVEGLTPTFSPPGPFSVFQLHIVASGFSCPRPARRRTGEGTFSTGSPLLVPVLGYGAEEKEDGRHGAEPRGSPHLPM